EAVFQTTREGLGQTTAAGIGGDPVKGTEFVDVLEMFLADKTTESIVMIGEIGGPAREDAAQFLIDEGKPGRQKPRVGCIGGGADGAGGPAQGACGRHYFWRQRRRRIKDCRHGGGRYPRVPVAGQVRKNSYRNLEALIQSILWLRVGSAARVS